MSKALSIDTLSLETVETVETVRINLKNIGKLKAHFLSIGCTLSESF